jgi:hypothetical protein
MQPTAEKKGDERAEELPTKHVKAQKETSNAKKSALNPAIRLNKLLRPIKAAIQIDKVRRFLLFCRFVDYDAEYEAEERNLLSSEDKSCFHILSDLQTAKSRGGRSLSMRSSPRLRLRR